MLVVVSPAKRLDWAEQPHAQSQPDFAADANRLAGHARQLRLSDLRALMGLSDDLARLNRDRFRAFAAAPDPASTRPAAFAFAGDTYAGLDAATMDAATLDYAQNHLRILSGLYGLLRPLDAIQPYRLEMGSRLKSRRGATLYDYWGDRLSKALNKAAEAAGTDVLVNCASQEYFGAVDRKALGLRVVTPQFYEVKPGAAPKVISFFAKTARGAMARFIVENQITRPEGLRDFSALDYRFSGVSEDGATLRFEREHVTA